MPQTYNGASVIYSAYRRICGHRAGQQISQDIENDCLTELNLMLDEALTDELFVYARTPLPLYTLTAGVQQYTIGPTGTFGPVRPVNIENANIILTTSSPVIRKPIAVVSSSEWSLIGVQQIQFAIPLVLWYDNNFSQPAGNATINIWPGPLANYQLELFIWQQLQQFNDLVTAYEFPPAYASWIIWGLAERIAPMMRMYFKVQPDLAMIAQRASEAKRNLQSINVPQLMSECDPALLSEATGSGAFNYLTGGFGRSV